MANIPVRHFDLVVPLANIATAMRTTDTAEHITQARSGAVFPWIGDNLSQDDMNSTIRRSTRSIQSMPGIRTSTMETRITTTRTTSAEPVRSAEQTDSHHADFSFQELVQAYLDCRKSKRNSASALSFELDLERNLCDLHDDLKDGSYQPGKSICFVITRPKPREVWAADFRDRIVHHLLYNRISPRFYSGFIADSCACIPERGTLYGAKRLESKIRSITQNWSKQAWYLKLDIANFFVSINKKILHDLIAKRVHEPWWMRLTDQVLFHDPRESFEYRGNHALLDKVPAHKRLTNQPKHLGLPIGNLSSQFFANILLNALDQHIKHNIRCKHYIRYVDDMVLLHESPQWLNSAKEQIEEWLPEHLEISINPHKTILQPIDRGIDFVGQVIYPWRRTIRKRTVNDALQRVKHSSLDDLFETSNSYYGLFRQATHSHHQRAKLSNILRYRGYTVGAKLTKTYRRKKWN